MPSVHAGKVGIRFSPFTDFMDSFTDDPYDVYGYLIEELNKRELLYVHFIEPRLCVPAAIQLWRQLLQLCSQQQEGG